MIINGKPIGDNGLKTGQVVYLAERLDTVVNEIEKEYPTRKLNYRIIVGYKQSYLYIGLRKLDAKKDSILYVFQSINQEKIKPEEIITEKVIHVPLEKFDDWMHLKEILLHTLKKHIENHLVYIKKDVLKVTSMTQGEFTKITKKKVIKTYYINPYDSSEPFNRSGFFVTNKVNAIVGVYLKSKLQFIAIPSIDSLKDKRNLAKLIDVGSKVKGTYGTIIEGDTEKVVIRYREEELRKALQK